MMGISLHATNGERGDYRQATAAAFPHAFHHTTVRHPQSTTEHATQSLDRRLVCDRRNALRLVVLRADRPLAPRHHRLPLQVHVGAVLLRLLLLLCVRLHAADELVSAPGVADVLDADVDALLDVAVADLSVENDADGGLCDVVDDTSLAVVDLAGAVSIAATRTIPNPFAQPVPLLSRLLHPPLLYRLDHAYLVWHTLLDSTVCDHINDVSDLVLLEVGPERDHTLLLEVAGEG